MIMEALKKEIEAGTDINLQNKYETMGTVATLKKHNNDTKSNKKVLT